MAVAFKFIILMYAAAAFQGVQSNVLQRWNRGSINVRKFGEGSKRIQGISVYNGDVLAVRWKSSEVEVYDSSTLEVKASLNIPDLEHANGLAASEQCDTLYVTDYSYTDLSHIHTVEISNDTTQINTLAVDENTFQISIAKDGCSVVVALRSTTSNKIVKIAANGQTILTVNLPTEVSHPRQAIELSSVQFLAVVVVHTSSDGGSWRANVCHIDVPEGQGSVNGKLGNCFVPPPELDDFLALSTAVDRDGNIYVLDLSQNVIKLNSSLNFVEVVMGNDVFGGSNMEPTAMFLDEEQSRFYLAVRDYSTKKGSLLECQQS